MGDCSEMGRCVSQCLISTGIEWYRHLAWLVAATIEIMTTIKELSGVLKSTWKHPHAIVLEIVRCNKVILFVFEGFFFKNMFLLPCEK